MIELEPTPADIEETKRFVRQIYAAEWRSCRGRTNIDEYWTGRYAQRRRLTRFGALEALNFWRR